MDRFPNRMSKIRISSLDKLDWVRQIRLKLKTRLIQPQFDYACSVSYPNLTQKLKKYVFY